MYLCDYLPAFKQADSSFDLNDEVRGVSGRVPINSKYHYSGLVKNFRLILGYYTISISKSGVVY